jgi:hypothetical protein
VAVGGPGGATGAVRADAVPPASAGHRQGALQAVDTFSSALPATGAFTGRQGHQLGAFQVHGGAFRGGEVGVIGGVGDGIGGVLVSVGEHQAAALLGFNDNKEPSRELEPLDAACSR